MIKRILKICKICKQPSYIWSKGCCRPCWSKAFSKPIKTSDKVIKQISDKHKERTKEYQDKRDVYLKQNPICEFPGCNSVDIECHHKGGRIGDNLFHNFMSVCREHHAYIHSHPVQAKIEGWLK